VVDGGLSALGHVLTVVDALADQAVKRQLEVLVGKTVAAGVRRNYTAGSPFLASFQLCRCCVRAAVAHPRLCRCKFANSQMRAVN